MTDTETPTNTEITPVVVHRDDQGLQVFDSTHAWLIAHNIAPKATPAEIQVHLMKARNFNLCPFTGQIWLVPRRDANGREVHKSEVGIAGARFIAERSGQYGGSLDPEWLDAQGNWLDVWVSDDHPVAARVRVVRKDWAQPSTGTVTWAGTAVYHGKGKDRKLGPFWAKDGARQLAKCAEKLALDKAFPDVAGVLLQGEEGHEVPEEITVTRVDIDPAVKTVWGEFMQLAATLPDAQAFKTAVLFELADHEDGPVDKLVASELSLAQATYVLDAARVWLERPFAGDEEE